MTVKFPFCSYKISELPHVTQEVSKREKFNRFENNPGMFKGFENSNTFQHPEMLHLMTQHAPRKASDPAPATKRLAYERRSFIKETKSALKKAAKPNLAQNEFLSHFEEFHFSTRLTSDGK